MSWQDRTESLHLVIVCSRCKRKKMVQQRELWRKDMDLDLESYRSVPQELFIPENARDDDMLHHFAVNDGKYREESLLCGSCNEKYMGLRKRLLEAVNKKLLAFLRDEI